MEFGLGKFSITPKLGTRLIGQPEQLESDGKYTDLFARALYLKSIENDILFVSCDLLFLTKEIVDYLRIQIAKETSVKFENIIIHTTHTHAGPAVTPLFNESNVDQEESQKIYNGIIASAVQSYRTIKKCHIGFGRSYRNDLAFNRRYVMRDGSVELHPHKDDPNILQAEGPSDPEINILVVQDEQKRVVGMLANFSCHLTSLERSNRKFSADFPAFAEEELQRHFNNNDFIMLYMNGPCGNVCQVNVENRETREVGIEHTKKMGKMFSESILQALDNVEFIDDDASIKTLYREIQIPIRTISENMLAEAKETIKQFEGKNFRVKNLSEYGIESHKNDSVISTRKLLETEFWQNVSAHELLQLHERYKKDNRVVVPLTIVAIGQNLIATIPAELFVEFALQIKNRYRGSYSHVLVFELTNGWVGYVPTKKAFQPENGGYEVQLLNSSKLCEDAGTIITNTIFQMVNELPTSSCIHR
jgi:hypothetical protein